MRFRSPLLDSRVSRRMVVLFVLCTLVPLVLSDWLASTAVSQVARDLQLRQQARATRQTSLQVFDRLSAARALLAGLPDAGPTGAAAPITLPPLFADAFVALSRLDDNGAEVWAQAAERSLSQAWRRSGHGASERQPAGRDEASRSGVVLRLVADSGTRPRLLLGASNDGRLRWIGELKDAYVWAPLADAAIDSVWRVTDAQHGLLAAHGDGEASSSQPVPESQVLTHSTQLFLAADFGADDWQFHESRAASDVLWHGMPLGGWLALVTVATVLVSALLSFGQIRRTLVPLQRLMSATRALAAGAAGTRVDIAGNDEFAELGRSFNEMAGRIDEQIGSLELLASIDRDVLAGTSIDVVAERVLDRLAATHPLIATALLWLDDGTVNAARALHGVARDAGATTEVRRLAATLTAAEAVQFAALAGDALSLASAAASWADLLPADDAVGEIRHWPLRWRGATRAVLSLHMAPAAHADLRELARELRDRLAVAFSARAREAEMVHRAVHDSLTELANRHGLNEFVDGMLGNAGSAEPSAVLFIDLDNFKDANDSLGHEAGDRVLCEAGRRLLDCAPAGALVARQGGDEFVLALPGADVRQARDTAAEVVRQLGRPFDLGGDMHAFGASVGIALSPQHGVGRVELMRHADCAMYVAKAAGRGRFHLFDDSLEAATQTRLRLPAELRRAIERGELAAHYQPRVCAVTGRTRSVEALVRWHHPERGLLMPDSFIALAEESRIIDDIGLFMLDDACARMACWQRQGVDLRRVSVNVSPRQLMSGELPGRVRAVLQRHQVPARALELEVTESLLVADTGGARGQLAELRRMGVTIALDDFGTGYSSMSMLRNLPIDVMKIDRAFVKDIGVDESAFAITRAIATLAQALGLHLVAEGVETSLQASLLAELGCDEFQGYLYSRPLTPAALETFLRDRQPQPEDSEFAA